ncbi:NAD(P)H-dependent oxidoreductase [Streptomyces capparidis]
MSAAPATLVVLAHPTLSAASRVNAAMGEAVRDLPGVTLHDLYATYPDGRVDVEREQALLRAHQRIVLQFPFYWYSMTPLLKQWIDEVFLPGFAYASGGDALRGKALQAAVSVGGGLDDYGPGREVPYTVEELLRPLELTAQYTGMRYLEPVLLYGAEGRLGDGEIAEHAARYRALLSAPAEEPVAA